MDDKTAELRDIFMSVADDETVTERQEESPGSLTGDAPIDERLDAVIDRMRERYTFSTDQPNEALRTIARGYFDDRSDSDLATDLDIDESTIRQARFDLHLLRESDRDGPVPFETVRKAVGEDTTGDVLADADPIDRDRLLTAARVEREQRRVNYRFRDEFVDLLDDGDIANHFTDEVTDDGLQDATEGLEVDTSF